jgi:hypothetical protein
MAEREHQEHTMDKTVQTALDTIVRLLAQTAAQEIIGQTSSCSSDTPTRGAEQENDHD